MSRLCAIRDDLLTSIFCYAQHVTGYRETCANLDHVFAKKAEILQEAVLGSHSLEAD